MGVSELIKITEEEKIAIDNDFDPIDAPPGPYKVQPDVPGIIDYMLNTINSIFSYCRKNNMVFWFPWYGQVHNSTTAGKKEWICLL